MKKIWLSAVVSFYIISVHANITKCNLPVNGYKVVKNSIYLFLAGKEKSCFFAFYTKNPSPKSDLRGEGNLGDALWYGYYSLNNPNKVYEFPKPANDDWSDVCSLEAVSFRPMYDGIKHNVTVIGSCNKQNIANYTFPFIFTWHNGKYTLDEKIFSDLFGFISLTISDLQRYIRFPKSCYKILHDKFNPDNPGPIHCP